MDVVALRVFLPAKDFEVSFRFYVELGFEATRLSDALASMQLGVFSFFLQKYDAEGFAEHFMMQMLVQDLDAWWSRIVTLDLASAYGVPAPQPPALQPWGLRVSYVVDPTGVLWHIAEQTAP